MFVSPVRLARITNPGRTFVDFQFLDTLDDQTFRAPTPYPHAGRGGGIFSGIEKDTIVLVTFGPGEKYYIVAVIPDHSFYFDLSGAEDIRFDEQEYPAVKPGEIILRSNKGSTIGLTADGNLSIDSGLGTSAADIELSRSTNTLYNRSGQIYEFTEFGRAVQGIIKRDLNVEEDPDATNVLNFLDSEAYDRLLSPIGRHPLNEVHNRTTTLLKRAIRNPALVEKRNIVYEYADSFNVQDFEKEVSASTEVELNEEIDLLQKNTSVRKNRRTDVLNLNLSNFNHLIEHIEGTVVDIYGNILDINRKPINIPEANTITSSGNATGALRETYDYLRRSIKLHYEINSRKPISSAEPPELDKANNNGINFGKWSIDVDGEGLTKINIPASSDTGNIPILSRYFNSRDPENIENGAFKDGNREDIKISQFGPGGINIADVNYIPTSIDGAVAAGTAWHDMTKVANKILSTSPIKTSVNNKIGDAAANAGGRSINANLDGSLELSIGADTVDKKSIMLDTKGGIVSHIGSDLNGKSIVSSTDGEIILQIGGNPITDAGTSTPKVGRLIIYLNRDPANPPQKIIIDENGLTFDIQGGMYFKSSGDMVFDSGSRLLLHGEIISMYGSGNINTRRVGGAERLVLRDGTQV